MMECPMTNDRATRKMKLMQETMHSRLRLVAEGDAIPIIHRVRRLIVQWSKRVALITLHV